jgi:hypothetical protein
MNLDTIAEQGRQKAGASPGVEDFGEAGKPPKAREYV